MNLKTQFKQDAEGTRVEVLALSSRKGGISVRVRRKAKGDPKFIVGMRKVFAATEEKEALACYAALVVEAEGEGWEVSASKVGGGTSGFSAMPKPVKAAPVGEGEAEPEAEAEGKAANGAKKAAGKAKGGK